MTHLLALILLVAAPPEPFDGRVVVVADGDTLTVLKARTQIKVRLHGIDCPESGQDFGQRAKQFTSVSTFGQVVTVRPRDIDRYGRVVGDVILADGRTLNQELVNAGLAWWYRKYAPADGTLRDLEAEARAAKRGLWADAHPISPWDWRRSGNLPPAIAGKVIGNHNSHIFHWPGCPNAAKILEKNRVTFESDAAAAAAGYRAGKDCHH